MYLEKYADVPENERPCFDGNLWHQVQETRNMCMYAHKPALGGLPSNFLSSSSQASNANTTGTSAHTSAPTSPSTNVMLGLIQSLSQKVDMLIAETQANKER